MSPICIATFIVACMTKRRIEFLTYAITNHKRFTFIFNKQYSTIHIHVLLRQTLTIPSFKGKKRVILKTAKLLYKLTPFSRFSRQYLTKHHLSPFLSLPKLIVFPFISIIGFTLQGQGK